MEYYVVRVIGSWINLYSSSRSVSMRASAHRDVKVEYYMIHIDTCGSLEKF